MFASAILRRSLIMGLFAGAVARPAVSETYPARNITFIVSFAAGAA
jgi:tripartite-type tricarboxylate transporter receptor subunit TctC